MLRGSVRQIQSRAFPARGAEIWAVYAGLCTLVHDKRRGGWSSPAGQANLKALIIKDMQPGTWRFLSDGGHTAQQERFLGKREWLRRSVALPGRLWEGDSSAEPGVSKDFQAPLCMSLIIKVLKGGRFLLPSPKATDLPNLSGAQISFCSGGRSAATP